MIITTRLGDMDDSLLQKLETAIDNDSEYTITVEYCLLACDGDAHKTNVAQGVGCFCPQHVHRSAHVTKKQWPEELHGLTKDLTQPDDLRAWATDLVDRLQAERIRTGRPVALEGRFTEQQLDAVRAVMQARPELTGSVSKR